MIDYTKAVVIVKKEENSTDSQKIPFREFTEVIPFNEEKTKASLAHCHKNYKYGFWLKSNVRNMELFCNAEDEREMWMAGFKYVILSTRKV